MLAPVQNEKDVSARELDQSSAEIKQIRKIIGRIIFQICFFISDDMLYYYLVIFYSQFCLLFQKVETRKISAVIFTIFQPTWEFRFYLFLIFLRKKTRKTDISISLLCVYK